jgi:superfamily II DNA or RNA helicase
VPPDPPLTRDALPRVGALATVRNRRGVIATVDAAPTDEGEIHLVGMEYLDADGPLADLLVWEREPAYGRTVIEPTALPRVDGTRPMAPAAFDALLRATRWGALRPFVDPDGSGPLERLPVASPFHGAIQVEDYQLVPLLKALEMPRVTLLLADDVGIGKTVEAGLILAELIQRRRIRRVLVLCPASLRRQWQLELGDKFALGFEIVDRESTFRMRRQLGMDASPWRAHAHVIVSFDFLKQPDVLDDFLNHSRSDDTASLPWDLLIVDEVHNLAPALFGEDSDASRTLQEIAPLFEHRLFLSATPHNGHTPCFTGLLECLDPVRFAREREFTDRARARAGEIVIRRLKREINARRTERGEAEPFCARTIEPVRIALGPGERALGEAFGRFRERLRGRIAGASRGRQTAGRFAVEVLKKRLLSCPVAFADSWRRYRLGLETEQAASDDEVRVAGRAAREELADDAEIESRLGHAAAVVGAWLKPWADTLADEMLALDAAIAGLGLAADDPARVVPGEDSRFEALCALIEARLRAGGRFRDDERLVIFTEFKTTLDYLAARLTTRYAEPGRIRVLYGGMEGEGERAARDRAIAAFNDPADPVRVLVSTDAASEGLNLQESARLLLHYDVPWNPSRLEQRNGRLDRHGQARDVTVFHFVTDDDADLDFLAYVLNKVNHVREDLGSTGEVFDRALERRLLEGAEAADLKLEVDRAVDQVRGRADCAADDRDGGRPELERLHALAAEVDLDADSLRETLDLALGLGSPGLEGPDARGFFRLRGRLAPQWQALVDDTLRRPDSSGGLGDLRALAFDPQLFVREDSGRPVFRPAPDAVLLHLGHPLFHQALAWYARARFPGTEHEASRWTVRRSPVPEGDDALLFVTFEEMAVNDLRETFHHWVRTVRFAVRDSALGPVLPHAPARELRVSAPASRRADLDQAQRLWADVQPELRRWLATEATALTTRIREALKTEGLAQRERERERFKHRRDELAKLARETTRDRLVRELEETRALARQGHLFDPDRRLELEREAEEIEQELARRTAHLERLQKRLAEESERVLERLLPRRFTLRGEVRLFPVAVEIRLPESE